VLATLEQMAEIAADAAKEILRVYEQPFVVDFKGPDDPVTEADHRANHLICDRLRREFPGIPVVSEESPPREWADFRESDRVFFVDPLDGTREFVAKNGEFVVMIGLLEGERPTHGVLHAPATGTAWAGAVGEGAFRKETSGTWKALPALVERPLDQARVLVSKSRKSPLCREAVSLLAPREVLRVGSAGLKGAAVADGRADIYLAPEFAGSRWDSCAPEAIIRALGGNFTDVGGEPLDYRAAGVENDRGAVAAPPNLHREVIVRLSELLR
jgi:3'(2'), 5'-bisphosphate nucleotidase